MKGIVQEIMYCDKYNTNMGNILNGRHMDLTKSTTAHMKDVIAKDSAGRVVSHAQLKDTISNAGVRKTVQQIKSGHYSKTRVIGTEETAAKVNKVLEKYGVKQRVESSGISSKTTSRIADKTLGKMPTISTLSSAAKAGGVTGAAVGAGMEAISSIGDWLEDDKSAGEAAADVAVAGVKGGVTGAVSGVIGSAAAGATGSAIAAATATTVGSAVAGTAVGAAAIAAAPVVAAVAAPMVVFGLLGSLFGD
ncbi:hypothetical protein [uncultured Dialister sp.]|uniref:hypothetical protein n=1 Tax=uncultured Dialister sp. TaxID=278064 RepID=UPI00266EEF4E|nr:hypothetical protein [uncultured Dialister sp.]